MHLSFALPFALLAAAAAAAPGVNLAAHMVSYRQRVSRLEYWHCSVP
jgi:hypothetical protein